MILNWSEVVRMLTFLVFHFSSELSLVVERQKTDGKRHTHAKVKTSEPIGMCACGIWARALYVNYQQHCIERFRSILLSGIDGWSAFKSVVTPSHRSPRQITLYSMEMCQLLVCSEYWWSEVSLHIDETESWCHSEGTTTKHYWNHRTEVKSEQKNTDLQGPTEISTINCQCIRQMCETYR